MCTKKMLDRLVCHYMEEMSKRCKTNIYTNETLYFSVYPGSLWNGLLKYKDDILQVDCCDRLLSCTIPICSLFWLDWQYFSTRSWLIARSRKHHFPEYRGFSNWKRFNLVLCCSVAVLVSYTKFILKNNFSRGYVCFKKINCSFDRISLYKHAIPKLKLMCAFSSVRMCWTNVKTSFQTTTK